VKNTNKGREFREDLEYTSPIENFFLGFTLRKYDGRTISAEAKRITHHMADFKP